MMSARHFSIGTPTSNGNRLRSKTGYLVRTSSEKEKTCGNCIYFI
jgi:hypothetical protein